MRSVAEHAAVSESFRLAPKAWRRYFAEVDVWTLLSRSRGRGATIRGAMEMSKPLGVLIVDDHAVVRAGLSLLLERERIVPLGQASTAQAAVERAAELCPQVVLLDVTMPGESGIDAIPRILESSPATKVVVLSMHNDPSYVWRAFDAGAQGYLLKEAADNELVTAVRQVAAGESYLSPALGARVLAAEQTHQAEAAADPLSPREHEVLRLLALGHTNHEIATQLSISVRTAETHRAHIMRKLDLSTRADLVRYALAHHMLPSNTHASTRDHTLSRSAPEPATVASAATTRQDR